MEWRVAVGEICEEARAEDRVVGLVVLGSHGFAPSQDSEVGSDLDILCLLSEHVLKPDVFDFMRSFVDKIWDNSRVLAKVEQRGKVDVYLRCPSYLKVDMGFAWDVEHVSRFLRGSEGCEVVLDKTEGQSLGERLQRLMSIKAHQCLDDYSVKYHRNRFVEMFDLMCKSIARCDRYRIQFYGQVVRHSLLVLQCMKRGETTHLYLPKHAFERLSHARIAQLPLIGSIEEPLAVQWCIAEEYAKLAKLLLADLEEGVDVSNRDVDVEEFCGEVMLHYRQCVEGEAAVFRDALEN